MCSKQAVGQEQSARQQVQCRGDQQVEAACCAHQNHTLQQRHKGASQGQGGILVQWQWAHQSWVSRKVEVGAAVAVA